MLSVQQRLHTPLLALMQIKSKLLFMEEVDDDTEESQRRKES
jgi:hypothetical protein